MKPKPKGKSLYQYRAVRPCLCCLAALLGLLLLLSSCSAKDASNTEAGLCLTLIDPYDASTDSGLTGICFTALKEEWLAAHPNIQLEETVIRKEDYSSVITSYASQNSLPDMFLIPANDKELWSDWGFLAEESEQEATPLQSSPILIVYDTEVWETAGYDHFPETWEELMESNSTFLDMDYDSALGIPTLSGGHVTTYLMPRIFAENCGTDWMDDMIFGNGNCVFLEDSVLNALEELAQITDSEVLTGYKDSVDAYLEGHCPAALITLNDLPALQDSDKWEQTGFALLPVSEASVYGEEISNTYYSVDQYILVISAQAAEDPEKLRVCVDFCRYLTETDTEETDDISAFTALLNTSEEVPNFVYHINISALNAISKAVQTWIDSESDPCTPAEIANAMQNGYEKYTVIADVES